MTNRDIIEFFDAGGNGGSTSVDTLDISGLALGTFKFIGVDVDFATDTGQSTNNTQAWFNSNTRILEIDRDGDDTADMEIELTNVDTANLDQEDFVTTVQSFFRKCTNNDLLPGPSIFRRPNILACRLSS